MKELQLTNTGYKALVDDEDYERCRPFAWYLERRKGYIMYSPDSGRTKIFLHNFILGVPAFSGVDHINRNKRDNTKLNLRFATESQQGQNKNKPKNNTSGFKGVSFSFPKQKYQAYIRVNYKQYHLGYFTTGEEAAKAYDIAATKHFGQQAMTNFPLVMEVQS